MAIAALRYNNPGNVSLPIRGYNGPGTVVGISGQPGYASFPTMQDGLNAQAARLSSYIDGSTRYGARTSIASLNGVYAEDQNWRNAVSRFSGIGVNDRLDPSNPQQMSALQGAIIRQETGRNPSVFGFNPSSVGNSNPTSSASSVGDRLGYNPAGSTPVGSSGVETSAGSVITNYRDGPENSGEVTLGFPGDNSTFGSSNIDGASFSGSNVSGGAQAGSFGLSGVMSGGQAVGGSGGALSLDGATLDKGVTVESVTGGPVGYNSGGPVIANPDLVKSTDKVASETKAGDEKITKGVETAGKTIGQAITSASSSWLDFASDTFLRLAFIVVGLVLFAAALWYFARPQIEAAASVAADFVPVGRVAKAAVGLAKRKGR